MVKYTPRYYQTEALIAAIEHLKKPGFGGLAVLPTGTGKSFIIADLIHQLLKQKKDLKILMITHVKELIEQNFEKLKAVWEYPKGRPPAGIFSVGLSRSDTTQSIVYGGIQSVYRIGRRFGAVDLLVIDECHRITESSGSMYGRFIRDLRRSNPNLRIIGLTATPYRADLGSLENGRIFDETFYDISSGEDFERLITEGFLCDLVGVKPNEVIDLREVQVIRGEFNQTSLDEYVNRAEITKKIVAETLLRTKNRKQGLAFCVTQRHAEDMASRFIEAGRSASFVHSELSPFERNLRIEQFRSGRLELLANVGVLTTGFDVPAIDYIVMARPTRSPSLHVQMLGRGMRTSSGKKDCLVLDYGGNIQRLGMVNDVSLPEPNEEQSTQRPKAKLCDACQTLNGLSSKFCRKCGSRFVANATEIKPEETVYRGEVVRRRRMRSNIDRTGTGELKINLFPRHQDWAMLATTHSNSSLTKQDCWMFINNISDPASEERLKEIIQGNKFASVNKLVRYLISNDICQRVVVARRLPNDNWKDIDNMRLSTDSGAYLLSPQVDIFKEGPQRAIVDIEPPYFSKYMKAIQKEKEDFKTYIRKKAKTYLDKGLDGRRPECLLGKGHRCLFQEARYSGRSAGKYNCTSCRRMTNLDEICLAIQAGQDFTPSLTYEKFVQKRLIEFEDWKNSILDQDE